MKYLLDSNTCVRFLNQRAPALIDRLADTPDEDILVFSVVKAEMFYGSERSARRERNLAVQRAFFARYVHCHSTTQRPRRTPSFVPTWKCVGSSSRPMIS
jgi:predicted nucleic acid-binding protein